VQLNVKVLELLYIGIPLEYVYEGLAGAVIAVGVTVGVPGVLES
jgi:hypothetical protein